MQKRSASSNRLKIVGFTGTHFGLTQPQMDGLQATVHDLLPIIGAHHGDCVGGDKDFDMVCSMFGIHRTAWPGMDQYGKSPSRAHCQAQRIMGVLPYLERDSYIAKAGVSGLIACPAGFKEELRSGTWATVRRARYYGRTIYYVLPDGRREVGDAWLA